MNQQSRRAKLRIRLQVAEAEFSDLLVRSLRQCKDGGPGIFLTESKAQRLGDIYPSLVWNEAKQLENLGLEIHSLRQQLGESASETLYTRYQAYCTRDAANDPGGARLAAEFLAEVEAGLK
jgi:hypothetical protein